MRLLGGKESGEILSEVRFMGGREGKRKWLDNGKTLSRNYRQGDRVYDSDGIATTLTAQPVGATGGYTSLYLVKENATERGNKNRMTEQDKHKASNNKPFTYASLFSGIGGFELGLNKFNGECVFASEYDPKAKIQFNQIAYEKIFGYKPEGDITKIDEKDVPDHDLLVGGFPCQPCSISGKRKGFEDARGTLFFDIARIAKEKQPKALFLENVKGLVNHDKGNTLNVMIQTLCEIGYTVDFTVLNSKYFGVPQNRERVYIIAIRDDLIEQEDCVIEVNTIVPKGKRRIQKLDGVKTFNFDWAEQKEVATRFREV